ncbi:MAG: sulfatase [Deltaproteobacteria bacterium]|nr:sulfatase [Deltaproteobacteria bacterium]
MPRAPAHRRLPLHHRASDRVTVAIALLLAQGCVAPVDQDPPSPLVRRAALAAPTTTAAPPPKPLLNAWRLQTTEAGSPALQPVRLGSIRRPAQILHLPYTGHLDVPQGSTAAELWLTPGTALESVPQGCQVTLTVAWPGAAAVTRTTAAVRAADPGEWSRVHLQRSSTSGPTTLSVALTPSAACGAQPLWVAAAEVRFTTTGRTAGRRNVLLVVVDTLRRDLFDCTPETSANAPHLYERWCKTGSFFADAFSNSSWTYPAVTSMLTGLTPRAHGALRLAGTTRDLRPEVTTLPEVLGWSGFETFAVVPNPYSARALWRGFDRFYELFPAPGRMLSDKRRAQNVVDRLLEILREPRAVPFFGFVLLVDLHEPVDLPQKAGALPDECREVTPLPFGWEGIKQPHSPPTADEHRRMTCRRALYRASFLGIDRELARLMQALAESHLEESTAIVLASDHGEELWDHAEEEAPRPTDREPVTRWGVDHGHTLYQELTRVPLLLVPSAQDRGRALPRVDSLVAVADVFATVLGMAGIASPTTTPAFDLSPALFGRAPPGHPFVLSESTLYGPDRTSVSTPELRAIRTADGPIEVFARAPDPYERHPLPSDSAIARRGAALLHAATTTTTGYSPPSVKDLQALRALGYVK